MLSEVSRQSFCVRVAFGQKRATFKGEHVKLLYHTDTSQRTTRLA